MDAIPYGDRARRCDISLEWGKPSIRAETRPASFLSGLASGVVVVREPFFLIEGQGNLALVGREIEERQA